MKPIILFQILFFAISPFNVDGQNISISDFKIKIDTTLSEREHLYDERKFILSPSKNKVLIIGHAPSHSSILSIPVEFVTYSNDGIVKQKIFEIAYQLSSDINVTWISNHEILIKYPFKEEELVSTKVKKCTFKNKFIQVKYEDKKQTE